MEYIAGGDTILVHGSGKKWRLIDADSGLDQAWPGPLRDVSYSDRLAHSPDGRRVVRVVKDGGAAVHDARTGEVLWRLPRSFVLEYHEGEEGEEAPFQNLRAVVRFSPDGKMLLVAGMSFGLRDFVRRGPDGDRTAILLYNAEKGTPRRTIAFPLRDR